jgi:hypothetical protein
MFGNNYNYLVQVALESLPQFAKKPRVTKKPPVQVASEAHNLTEAEPTISNQQFR